MKFWRLHLPTTKILRIFHEFHVLGISKKKILMDIFQKRLIFDMFFIHFEEFLLYQPSLNLGHFPNKKPNSHLEVVCWPPWQSVTSSLNISFWRLVIYSVTLLGCWKHDPSQGIVDRWSLGQRNQRSLGHVDLCYCRFFCVKALEPASTSTVEPV